MRSFSTQLLLAVFLAFFLPTGSLSSAVVEPPDGKENPLTEPNEPLPKPTQRPAPDEKSVIPEPAAPVIESLQFNPNPVIRVDVLMVAVPQEQALLLLPELRDPAKFKAAEQRLIQMIGRKEATLIDWPEVTLHSGERSVSETITERRYPIEIERPQAPQSASSSGKAQRSTLEEALQLLRQAGTNFPITFETRNTGATLEAEAVASPNADAITITAVPQIVSLEKIVTFPSAPAKKEDALFVEQPLFQTRKINLKLTLKNGERRLIYVGKPQESEGKMELFILGAQILPRAK